MQLLGLIVSCAVFFLLINSIASEHANKSIEWEDYKSQKGNLIEKFIQTESDDWKRYEIFNTNMKFINAHNNRRQKFKSTNNAQYLMGPNHFTHLNISEIQGKYLSEMNMSEIEYSAVILNKNNVISKVLDVDKEESGKNLTKKMAKRQRRFGMTEETVNWAARGYLSPVTDQGGCGSCYAFSTAWAVESAYAIKNNVRINVNEFSKQQLVDCTYYGIRDNNNIIYNNVGCLGGNIYRTLLYVYNNGLELEADYPYISEKMPQVRGKVQDCKFDRNKFSLKINNYYGINFRNVNEMKRVVSRQPVIAYFFVTNEFYFYKSGIFTTTKCGKGNCGSVNHSVLIVGYGIENGIEYWLCKNSWGEDWGENGYFRVEMNSNMCCIEGYSMYPYL